MSGYKYEKLVYRFEPEYDDAAAGVKPMDNNPCVNFKGACQIPGSQFNIGYSLIREPMLLESIPHRHTTDEYLLFGSSTLNSKDWDAHIELTIGLGEEAEVYSIDEPATIRIPAGVWHGRINFIRVNKPVFYQPGLLQGNYSAVYIT